MRKLLLAVALLALLPLGCVSAIERTLDEYSAQYPGQPISVRDEDGDGIGDVIVVTTPGTQPGETLEMEVPGSRAKMEAAKAFDEQIDDTLSSVIGKLGPWVGLAILGILLVRTRRKTA